MLRDEVSCSLRGERIFFDLRLYAFWIICLEEHKWGKMSTSGKTPSEFKNSWQSDDLSSFPSFLRCVLFFSCQFNAARRSSLRPGDVGRCQFALTGSQSAELLKAYSIQVLVASPQHGRDTSSLSSPPTSFCLFVCLFVRWHEYTQSPRLIFHFQFWWKMSRTVTQGMKLKQKGTTGVTLMGDI